MTPEEKVIEGFKISTLLYSATITKGLMFRLEPEQNIRGLTNKVHLNWLPPIL